jgi:hypothetical protein
MSVLKVLVDNWKDHFRKAFGSSFKDPEMVEHAITWIESLLKHKALYDKHEEEK